MLFTKHLRACLLALALAPFFMPRPAPGAGFYGPGTQGTVTSAKDALQAADDAPCVLEGKIIARVPGRKNRYIFADQSGRIVVEIKRKVFAGRTVTPENMLRLEGEVDWSPKHPNEVEVDEFAILR